MKKFSLVFALAVAMMFGIVASAHAASGTVTINAAINSKLILTVPADHNFGAMDPTDAPASYSGNVNVRSNIGYTIGRGVVSDFPAGVLSCALPAAMDGSTLNAKAPGAGGFDWAQTWTVDPAPGGVWADPGSYTAVYTYTTTPL